MSNCKHTYPIKRICFHCNKEFLITSANRLVAKFCSQKCNWDANCMKNLSKVDKNNIKLSIQNRDSRGNKNSNYRGGGLSFNCVYCKNEFKVPNHAIKSGRHTGKFCSKTCQHNYWRENKISKHQNDLNRLFRRHLSRMIKKYSIVTANKWFEHLGYSLEDFKIHMENQFKIDMNWGNHGKVWHVDHIKPTSYFKFSNINDKEFKECWALHNLQPLYVIDNLTKGGKNTKINQMKYGK